MKKICTLLFVSFFLFSIQSSKASHIAGGEIGWECLSNGKYVFKMQIFRDCSGIPFLFQDVTLDIIGTPLPKNEFEQFFNSIVLQPDSNQWLRTNFGNLNPVCSSQDSISCANGDPASLQAFFYKSDTIELNGIPPSGGWHFFWTAPCCRPDDFTNLNGGGLTLLRAIMYPTKNRDYAIPCIDSSPEFRSLPSSIICRGETFTYKATAIDRDLDSMIYSWSKPINQPIGNPSPLIYKAGFSDDNPTPDSSFDVRNIPSTLNPSTGKIDLAVYSGSSTEKFLKVLRLDSYRDGEKVSSIFREYPVFVVDCSNFPMKDSNEAPKALINGVPLSDTTIRIRAGAELRLPIQFLDADTQMVKVRPEGALFTADRSINSLGSCFVVHGNGNDTIQACAYLQQQPIKLDSSLDSYYLEDLGGFTMDFVWQTDCSLLSHLSTGEYGREEVFDFTFQLEDDFCPLPAMKTITISVIVQEPPLLTEPIMKGASIGLDGSVTYQWVPPMDSVFSFHSYSVQSAAAVEGNPPSFLGVLNPDLRVYQQERRVGDLGIYRPIGGIPGNGPNLLNKVSNRDWYLRMRTITSVCNDSIPSEYSEPVRVIELDATPTDNSEKNEVLLNWNRPKPIDSDTYTYLIYESPTHFYVWQNDSADLSQIANESNWRMKTHTIEESILLKADACGNSIAYRVEARDTVITYKQGSSFRNPQLDTLTFSTFSTIDTTYLSFSKPNIRLVSDSILRVDFFADNYQWYDCHADTVITSENESSFVPKDSGNYAVIVNKLNCTDTSDCFQYFSVGIEKVDFQDQLTVYPNPTNGQLFIEFATPQNNLQVRVFSIHGQMVMEQQHFNKGNLELQLQGKAGIYFVKLINGNGERANLKVVKR